MRERFLKSLLGIVILLALWGVAKGETESNIPFGFKEHSPPTGCRESDAPPYRHYSCAEAPRVHPDIRRYHLYYMNGLGLCFLVADSWNVPAPKFLSLVTRIASQLSEKYGPPDLKPEKWEPQFYMWKQLDGAVEEIRLSPAKDKIGWAAVLHFLLRTPCDQKLDERGRDAF